MLDNESRSKILTEYDSRNPLLSDFKEKLHLLVSEILRDGSYVVHSITSRCKDRTSLANKLSRPEKTYGRLADITDVVGLRITTYFADDVDRIANLLKDEFAIDVENSVDRRQTLDPDRFGYQSLHYVAELPNQRCSLPEYRRFAGIKFELQLRSILQHAWAEIEHDIGYKSGAGVPREIRRRFSRVAGLLELADAEFLSIREALSKYSERIQREIHEKNEVVELNLVSLRALYSFESSLSALDNLVAEEAGSEIQGTPENVRESLLQRLLSLGVVDVGSLEKVAAAEADTVKRFAKYWLNGDTYEALDVGVGLFYLIYILLWRTKDRQRMVDYFASNTIGSDPQGDASRLFSFSLSSDGR